MKKRSEGSGRPQRGLSVSIRSCVGTVRATVIPSSSTACRKPSASKPSKRTIVPPRCQSGVAKTFQPPVWKNGVETGATSPGPSSHAVVVATAFHRSWRRGRTAPLGFPVLPEV